MLTKLQLSLRPASWLLALLIITSVLPAKAQEEPFLFELTEDGSGYIMKPRPYETYEGVLDVPAVRESDSIPIVSVEGFDYRERLLGIQFYEGSQVKKIGSFKGCTGIEFVSGMPNTVETIGDYAFYGCTRLHDISLSEGLKYIGISCFEGCTSLESFKLPRSLKVLREHAFRLCTALQTVEFAEDIDFYTDQGGFYSYGFYNNVFDGCESLHTVILPKSASKGFVIPPSTFSWCSNLKSIEFPANTRGIGQMAFYRSGIENLDLTAVTSDKIYVEGYYSFAGCENLKSIKANGNFQFDRTSLYTFQDCKALKSVTINGSGDDYIEITPDAFRWCDNLETVEVYRLKGTGEINEMDSVFVGCKSLKKFTSICSPELNKIGYSCFDGCESLTEVPIPEQAFVVSETAFRGCAALRSLDLANVTSIGTKAFTGCSTLASISLKPSSDILPTVVNEDAFDEWHFANTLIEVPDDKYSSFTTDAFWSKFSSYKHPSLLAYTEVTGGYSVGKSPYALNEDFIGMLEIPGQYNSSDVVSIAESTFQDLTGLTGVTLPEKLTSIGNNAFAGCTNINTIINKRPLPLNGVNCPDNAFDNETYSKGYLYVPFGSLDAYKSYTPWSYFTDRIKQGFGERILVAPTPSRESCEFNYPFALALTNLNDVGTIYYYIVPQSNVGVATENEVHDVYVYTGPIKISSSCTVVAYVSDGTNYCEPISLEFTRQYVGTENGLDKVLSANDNEEYIINTALYGHYHDGTYLYASTKGNSGSSKNTFNEDKKSEELSDKEADFNQEDWVAISGLSSHFVGKGIDSGYMATVVSNTDYPVISFNEGVLPEEGDMGINKFRVENFNIHAENAAVSDIWLVAPQAAEYCSVTGYLKAGNIHEAEEYFVLQSAESATSENETAVEPLTMNVYYDPASITLVGDRWCSFTGIVSKAGDALKFTALYNGEMSIANTNAELISMEAGNLYQVNVSLEGVMVNGGVLYARTSDPSAAPSVPAETRTLIASADSDRLDQYNQRDWVAIEGLSLDYVGFELGSFIAEYDGATLTPVASTPAVGTAVDVTNLNMFTVANVFYGNYENTESLALENGYRPFYVKAKVNEVAYYVGLVKLNEDGKYELWGEGEVGKLNDKGLEIDTNGVGVTTSTKKIEGVLVADTEANGGVKLVAFSAKDIISGVETPEADGKAVIYGTKGAVVVAGADGKVTIFDAMGRKVKTVDANGVTTIQMPAGYYIVHTAETAKSVIVM